MRTDPQAALSTLREQLARLQELEAIDFTSVSAIQSAIAAQQERLAVRRRRSRSGAAARCNVAAGASCCHCLQQHWFSRCAPPSVAPIEPSPSERVARVCGAADGGDGRGPRRNPCRRLQPPKKREALSRLFAAFMEEKNIRWGELVGGLLIVGCSVALVISFWSEIAAGRCSSLCCSAA